MKKPWLTGLLVTVVGVAAVAVCLIGYRVNSERRYDQKVAYAQATADKEAEKMDKVEEAVAELFADKDKNFLNKDVTSESVDTLVSQLKSVKTKGEDFGIKDDALPDNIAALAVRKEAAEAEVALAVPKVTLQNSINQLFEKELDWQKLKDNQAITTEATSDEVEELREDVALISGPWQTLALNYLESADSQLKQADKVDQAIAEIYKDKKLTDSASFEKYYALTDLIAGLRNEEQIEQYTATAETIDALLTEAGYTDYGYYGEPEEVENPDESEPVDEYYGY